MVVHGGPVHEPPVDVPLAAMIVDKGPDVWASVQQARVPLHRVEGVVQPAASCCVTRGALEEWEGMTCKDLLRIRARDKTAARLPSSCCECVV